MGWLGFYKIIVWLVVFLGDLYSLVVSLVVVFFLGGNDTAQFFAQDLVEGFLLPSSTRGEIFIRLTPPKKQRLQAENQREMKTKSI